VIVAGLKTRPTGLQLRQYLRYPYAQSDGGLASDPRRDAASPSSAAAKTASQGHPAAAAPALTIARAI